MSARVDRGLAVAAAGALPAEVDNELRSTLQSLPMMIHVSGFAAACAYLLSRAQTQGNGDRYWKAARAVLDDAAEFIQLDGRGGVNPPQLLDKLVAADDQHYVAAERRAKLFATWLARIAAARHNPASDGTA